VVFFAFSFSFSFFFFFFFFFFAVWERPHKKKKKKTKKTPIPDVKKKEQVFQRKTNKSVQYMAHVARHDTARGLSFAVIHRARSPSSATDEPTQPTTVFTIHTYIERPTEKKKKKMQSRRETDPRCNTPRNTKKAAPKVLGMHPAPSPRHPPVLEAVHIVPHELQRLCKLCAGAVDKVWRALEAPAEAQHHRVGAVGRGARAEGVREGRDPCKAAGALAEGVARGAADRRVGVAKGQRLAAETVRQEEPQRRRAREARGGGGERSKNQQLRQDRETHRSGGTKK
jgi:hypothetical protein